MNNNVRVSFLVLVILQAIHSAEEFIFKFYDRFPPMRFLYQNVPHLAKPAFAISNALLILVGLVCFYYWVQAGRRGATVVVWIWIIMESLNVVAHIVWAVSIGWYNPGLLTGLLFVPVLIYLCYLMRHVSSHGVAEQLVGPGVPTSRDVSQQQ
jgi:hypothetical protein